jgi:hypothetical protein
MRKEGVLFLTIAATLLLVGANYYPLFNAFNLFIFAGVIPVFDFNIPDSFTFVFSVLALTALMTWPFRGNLMIAFDRKKKSLVRSQSKRRSPKTT